MKRYQHPTTQNTIRRGGFTLLELLIVLGIILAIAAMVVPNLLGRQQEANIKLSLTSIHNFEQTVQHYAAAHNGVIPTGDAATVVATLMKPQSSSGRVVQPYLDEFPKDAWGNRLNYEYPNTKEPNALGPAIWSSGPNGQNEDGGGDDVHDWKLSAEDL